MLKGFPRRNAFHSPKATLHKPYVHLALLFNHSKSTLAGQGTVVPRYSNPAHLNIHQENLPKLRNPYPISFERLFNNAPEISVGDFIVVTRY
jgi:hypothetical protein